MFTRLHAISFVTLLLCGLVFFRNFDVYKLRGNHSTSSPAHMDQFLLFGDSLTQKSFAGDGGRFNFGGALTNAYIRKLDVVNRGLSGYNSSQGLHVLPMVIPSPQQARLRFITVFFGANDARMPGLPGSPEQHVPLIQYKANLQSIVQHPTVKAHSDVRIILITPPPIEERNLLKALEERFPQLGVTLQRTATTTARYAAAVRELGQELQIPVLDIWSAMITRACKDMKTAGGPLPDPLPGSLDAPPYAVLQGYLYDGLHFTSDAYEVLYDELMNLIQTTWPDQMPDELERVLPDWDATAKWESVFGGHS